MKLAALRRVRVAEILRRRTSLNQTNMDIARSMSISVDTVQREIKWAANIGLLEEAKDQLIGEVAGLAMARLKGEISNPESKKGGELALRVVEGLGLLTGEDPFAEQVEAAGGLAEWVRRRGVEEAPAIDAELIEPKQLSGANGEERGNRLAGHGGSAPASSGTGGSPNAPTAPLDLPPSGDGHSGPAVPPTGTSEGGPPDGPVDYPLDPDAG